MSEDCLTINVLRPTGTPTNAKLPVASFDLTLEKPLIHRRAQDVLDVIDPLNCTPRRTTY
jgi:hypothetical protein